MSATAKKADETAVNATATAAAKPARSKRGSKQEVPSATESNASTQPAENAAAPSEGEQAPSNPPAAEQPSAPEQEAEKVEGWDTEPAERPADVPKAVQLSSGVKQVVQAVVHNCPATLVEIEVDIKKQMVNIANSFLRIGGLLIISKEFFDKGDKFLAWSEEKFGIKKAQVYKLMKVHTEFGEDARFKGVAMRVLDMLTGAPESVKTKAAKVVAITGKLETKQAQAIIDAETGTTTEPLSAEQLASIVEINPAAAGPQPDGEPTGAPATAPSAPAASKPAETLIEVQTTAAEGSEIAKLTEQLNRLMDELGNLRAENEALKNPKKRTAAPAPMLKQFKHADPCIVLGISQEEGKVKKEVKGAVRELSAIWNNDTNAEAWALISAAADALLKDAK